MGLSPVCWCCLRAGTVPNSWSVLSWTCGPRRCLRMVAGPGLAPHLGSAMAKMQEGEERLLGGVGETLLIWVLSLPPRTAEIQEEFGGLLACPPGPALCSEQAAV